LELKNWRNCVQNPNTFGVRKHHQVMNIPVQERRHRFWWLTPVILATPEAEIRRILV
jgi:hypothetical protein